MRWKKVDDGGDVIDARGSSSGGGSSMGGLPVGKAADNAEGIPADQDPGKDFKDFSSYVFVTAQQDWQSAFKQAGQPYDKAKMVIHRGGVNTGDCRSASSSGTEGKVRELQRQEPDQANELSVRMELQADCYAGPKEAIGAAGAVGDDTLQKSSGQGIPESFTRGTSAQRAKWFNVGYDTGEPAQRDTFSSDQV